MFANIFDHSRRKACNYGVWGDITYNHTARCDDRALANRNAFQNCGTKSNPRIVANRDGSRRNIWNARGVTCGPNSLEVFGSQGRIKRMTVEVMDVDLVRNQHPISDFHPRFRGRPYAGFWSNKGVVANLNSAAVARYKKVTADNATIANLDAVRRSAGVFNPTVNEDFRADPNNGEGPMSLHHHRLFQACQKFPRQSAPVPPCLPQETVGSPCSRVSRGKKVTLIHVLSLGRTAGASQPLRGPNSLGYT
jgi:hypothetical protein